MATLIEDNAYSELASSLASGATSMTVTAATGNRFPVVVAPDDAYVTLEDANTIEVVRITDRALGADSMTIVRGQLGTTARATTWAAGAVVECRPLAALMQAPMNHAALTAAAHAASAIQVTPTDSIAATNVQAALAEIDGDVTASMQATINHAALTAAAHAASAIQVTPTDSIAATNVQAALAEIDGDVTALSLSAATNGANSDITSLSGLTTPLSIAQGGTGGTGGAVVYGLFYKTDLTTVAFTKTGAGTAQIKAGTKVDVSGTLVEFASATSITMPTLAAGTDYAIWLKDDATIQATTDFTSAPGAGNWRKIGGFHYAPGGNAPAQAGGNTTAQINEYSFWDLKFRPACPDPRGMTLVAGGFWSDIYLTGVDAITNGSSKYNVSMADGSSPPKVPTMFGGNGSTTYGSYTWFEAMELATAFGKRCPTQQEFMSLAYGTTQASSIGTDQASTILNASYTSKWGVIQSTGVMWLWARDRGGPYAGASWNANTEGRGSEYNAPRAALFGGSWNVGSVAGSRCSHWADAASVSSSSAGSRFVCDHLQLD